MPRGRAFERRPHQGRGTRHDVVERTSEHAAVFKAGMAADDFASACGIDDRYHRRSRPDQSADRGCLVTAAVEAQLPRPFVGTRAAAGKIEDNVVRTAGVAPREWREVLDPDGSEWICPRQPIDRLLDRRHERDGERKRCGSTAPFERDRDLHRVSQPLDKAQVPVPWSVRVEADDQAHADTERCNESPVAAVMFLSGCSRHIRVSFVSPEDSDFSKPPEAGPPRPWPDRGSLLEARLD